MFYNRIFIPGTSPCESERGAEARRGGRPGGAPPGVTGGGSGVHWVETLRATPALSSGLCWHIGSLQENQDHECVMAVYQMVVTLFNENTPPPHGFQFTGNYGRILWLDMLLMARLLSSLLPPAVSSQRAMNQVKLKFLEAFPM